MSDQAFEIKRFFSRLADPKAILLGLALFNFFWALMNDMRFDFSLIDYHGYFAKTNLALIILVASGLLLPNRAWSCLIAFGICGKKIFFDLGFSLLLGISNALNVPMLSSKALHQWWVTLTSLQPQYVVVLILASLIMFVAFIQLIRLVRITLHLKKAGKPENQECGHPTQVAHS